MVVPRVHRGGTTLLAAGACPMHCSSNRPSRRFSSPTGSRGTQLYYRPPSFATRRRRGVTGLQGVPSVRKNPRRPRGCGCTSVNSVGGPMEVLVYNGDGSPGAAMGPSRFPFLPHHPTPRTLRRTPQLTPRLTPLLPSHLVPSPSHPPAWTTGHPSRVTPLGPSPLRRQPRQLLRFARRW